MPKRRGRIFIISSPSGCGKTTLLNSLKKSKFDIERSVSATTRRPRKAEKNKRDYYFLKEPDFKRLLRRGEFLEWTDNFGDLYGTPRRFVGGAISKGKDIILSIDVKGAMAVKKIYKDAVLIFLLPPSMKILEKRLKGRKSEGREMVFKRLRAAQKELSYLNRYDYKIVNANLAKAVKTLKAVITAERNRRRKLYV